MSLQNTYEVPTPSTAECDYLEMGSLLEVVKLKMRSLGAGLIQRDWHPRKKRKLVQKLVQKEDDVRTQGEDDHLQAKERGLE